MVHSKADRERKKQTEKCQSQIEALLRLADNKYCVDCDAKGPRWSSWNLGVFLCIRCAGIHRNLGVHISRVKSVNLDAWSPEQVERVEQMGNSKARSIYEANLPEDFRRPQTDTALESFIRAKYEHKKYISHDFVEGQQQQPQSQAQPTVQQQQPHQKQTNLLAMDDDENDQTGDLSGFSLAQTIAPLPKPPSSTTTIASSLGSRDLHKLQDTIPTTNDLINFE